jgi:hypothetical protein
MTIRDRRERRAPGLRYAVLLIAGLYPFAMTFGDFAGIEPLDHPAVWRTLAVSCAVTFLLYGLFRLVFPDRDGRAQWLGVLVLLWGAYPIALGAIGRLGLTVMAPNPLAALLFVVATVSLVTLLIRPWQRRQRDLVPLLLVAVALVTVNGYRGVARLWATPSSTWKAASDSIVEVAARRQAPTTPARDIYYIVLDGLGRADTLQDHYGLDIRDFITSLEAQGFLVPRQARSNYAHSFLSFSSFLNLNYLDALGTAMGRNSTSWVPLADLIQRNSLMRLARESGYQIVAIGSDYGPTKRFSQADVCFCEQRGLDMFEQVAIGHTPLIALPLDRWTYDAHRRKVLDAFSTLETLPPSATPRLVVAHILAPHPPFTFGPDGSPRRPDRAFMFSEGSDFPGSTAEYVEGYRDQTTFMIHRLRQVIETILNRPGPRPAIVVHGDHGPGSMLQLNDPTRTNLSERMNIFAAYYFPGEPDRLYSSLTPVNGARALANAYLGTDLPRLPDTSWFSTAMHPYDFTMVPAEAGAPRK